MTSERELMTCWASNNLRVSFERLVNFYTNLLYKLGSDVLRTRGYYISRYLST